MLSIIKCNSKILNEAFEKLPKEYIESLKLKPNFEESLIARYIIFKEKNILIDTKSD
jgi:hypothetical protein